MNINAISVKPDSSERYRAAQQDTSLSHGVGQQVMPERHTAIIGIIHSTMQRAMAAPIENMWRAVTPPSLLTTGTGKRSQPPPSPAVSVSLASMPLSTKHSRSSRDLSQGSVTCLSTTAEKGPCNTGKAGVGDRQVCHSHSSAARGSST